MSIKKLCLAMAAAGLCASAANAAHMGDDVMLPAAPPTVNVTIPQYQGYWQCCCIKSSRNCYRSLKTHTIQRSTA